MRGPAAGEGYPFAGARRVLRRYDGAFEAAFGDPGVAVVPVRAVEYGCFLYEVGRG
ncbi:hypothetical protein GCM10023084_41120 [Streptomyces lacrimifluminis]|uniref:Uncharacterized protein n=1 Tax=Streptomyces lacrimifluminis TaxID=1500077 RepID=A0A917P051_9ACTN|nr:hypothetical protein GCM10012282_42750 [Streptomyces lacrimifluminis]